MFNFLKIGHDIKFGIKIAQMFLFLLIFLNLFCCIWIKIFEIDVADFKGVDYGISLEKSIDEIDIMIEDLVEEQGYPY